MCFSIVTEWLQLIIKESNLFIVLKKYQMDKEILLESKKAGILTALFDKLFSDKFRETILVEIAYLLCYLNR